MSRSGGTTLYVTGFGHGTRARDLAFEFERLVHTIKFGYSNSLTISDMVDWFVVTFLLPELLAADCKYSYPLIYICPDFFPSFAFVEYESRRDADDAYHEMHNKRIGRDRDEALKIEVSCFTYLNNHLSP
jgi:hypothetical protein